MYSAPARAKLHRVEFENTSRVETRLDGFQNELTDVKQALNILVQAHLKKTQNISKSMTEGRSNSSGSVANTPQQENLALCKLLDFDAIKLHTGELLLIHLVECVIFKWYKPVRRR